ncbi:unnamed protein product, partial [Closterium sp. Naga37s-1]
GVLLYGNHRDSLELQFLSLQASLAADKASAPFASLLTPIFLPLAANTPASSPATPPPPPALSLLWDPSSSCCDPNSSAAAPPFPPSTTLVVLGGEAVGEVRVLAGPTSASLTSSPSSSSPFSPLQWHRSAPEDTLPDAAQETMQGEAALPDLELLSPLVARLSQQASRHAIIPYSMKWSRELDFLKRRAFPLLPSPSPSPSASPSPMPAAPALLFSPLILSQPLTASDSHNHSSSFSQLPWPSTSSPTLDSPSVVLHKATDEIVQVDASMDGVHLTFSQPFQHLLDHCSSSSGSLKIIDPLPAVLPLTDRVKTLSLLSDLLATTNDTGNPPASPVLRVPRFVQVPDIRQTAAVLAAMAAVGVRLPVIVKPRIACGAAASHAMAIVFSEDAFATLSLPSPSVIQEYVDHGACQFKCYVLGEAFFAAERRSTPDAAPLLLQQQGQAHGKVGQQQQEEEEEQRAKVSAAPAAISFDSLKSLPMAFPSQPSEQQQLQQPPLPPLGVVGGFNEAVARRAADLLRSALGLTLFGFDVLVQEGTGEHVVVDVNYFPSFKDVPDHLAIPAFHTACASHLV